MRRKLTAIGGYGEEERDNLFLFEVAPNGSMVRLGAVRAGIRPSYLLFSSPTTLHAVNERNHPMHGKEGLVKTFSVPTLEETGVISTEGEDPCFLCTDPSGKFLLATNYASGSVAIFSLDEANIPSRLIQLIHYEGSGPVKDRQECSHPHSILFDPERNVCYVADLGADRLHLLGWNPRERLPATKLDDIVLDPGSGPRMMRFTPDRKALLVADELGNSVTRADLADGSHQRLFSTLEGDGCGCTAAHLETRGDLVIVSTRGEDTIVVSSPQGLRRHDSLGRCPRFFALEDDRLFVANQDSDSVASYRIEPDGTLADGRQVCTVPRPTCIAFRNS